MMGYLQTQNTPKIYHHDGIAGATSAVLPQQSSS